MHTGFTGDGFQVEPVPLVRGCGFGGRVLPGGVWPELSSGEGAGPSETS